MKNIRAMVLKRTDYRDADRIVTLFTREFGRISGIARFARSSRRRFGGALEPGSLVDVTLAMGPRRGTLYEMKNARVLRGVSGFVKSMKRLNAVMLALKLAMAFLQEEQAVQEKFDILNDYIAIVSGRDPRAIDALLFELKWISYCGFAPHLDSCIRCKKVFLSDGGVKSEGWTFSYPDGGVLCGSCVTGRGENILHENAVNGLRAAVHFDGAHVLDDEASAALAIIRNYIEHILGRSIYSNTVRMNRNKMGIRR